MNLSHAYSQLFAKTGYSFIYMPDGECVEWNSPPMWARGFTPQAKNLRIHLVPGSFNPLHTTHKEIFELIDCPLPHAFFEISVERVDKDMVTLPELGDRLKQFNDFAPVVVNRAPRFVTKIGTYLSHVSKLTFHVGIDTITRMADDYGIMGIQGLAANFVVHDRIMNGKHKSLYSEFGENIPRNCLSSSSVRSEESLSRSSTEIRQKGNKV